MPTWRRNQHGYKDTADCIRHFNGEEYVGWMAAISPDRIAAYRAAEIRCRKVGADLFVHHMDLNVARDVDRVQDAQR